MNLHRLWILLALVSSSLATGAVARPCVEDELDGGPAREREYFQDWVGPLDPQRLHQMWDEVQASPSEPPAGGAEAAINSWELIGPLWSENPGGGRMTGRVRDIDAIHGRVLAASGGLWRFNFGAVPMTESVPASFFGTFATNPHDDQTIILGTGEFAYGGTPGTGIYKTTDGGATWAHKGTSPEPSCFTKIRYGVDGALLHAASTSGYYRSSDAGETWTRLAFANQNVTDIATVSGDRDSYPWRLYATVSDQGLWRSDDYGSTWTQLAGLPTSGTGVGAVIVPPHLHFSPDWIYVSFTNAGVWRSQDAGASWAEITPPSGPARLPSANTISACPTNRSIVLLGGVGFHRSTDAGATWTLMLSSHLHADYHVFEWDADGIGVWVGNDGGWFYSTDRGLTWDSSSNVMPVTQFYNIACENTEFGYMLGGSQDNAVEYCEFEGYVWNLPATGSSEGDGAGVCLDLYIPSHLWAMNGVPYARYRSLNSGGTWQDCDNGINDPGSHAGDMRTDRDSPVRLYTSSGRYVYESTDLGDQWSATNASNPFPASVNRLTASARVAPSAVLYAAIVTSTSGQRLYVRDGGNWYERDAGLPGGVSVRTVVPHPVAARADEAWALMNGTNSPGQKIYHTTNRGVVWQNITGDLPNVPLGDMVADPYDSSRLWLGTFLGCYRTTNGGQHWERWNNGLPPNVLVTEMSYIDTTPSGGGFYVIAGTYGRSVWQREIGGSDPLAAGDPVSNPAGLRLEAIGPNPFARQTALRFFLPQRGSAKIEVFDVRGRQVSTAVDGVYSAGPHDLSLSGNGLSPGVYYCRLREWGSSAVQRLTLIR